MRSKNLNLILAAIALMIAIPSHAAKIAGTSYQKMQRNLVLPTQVMLEHQTWAGPLLAATNYINTTFTQTSSTIVTKTTFAHQPDFARNLTVTPGGTTGNNGTCNIVATGTDFYGATITETFANTATNSSALTGANAFNKVTSILFPAACSAGSGVSWIVGIGSKLGMNRCTDQAGRYVFSVFDGAYETSRGTLAATSATISGNTFIPNGTMNGTKVVDLYFLQDYSCAP